MFPGARDLQLCYNEARVCATVRRAKQRVYTRKPHAQAPGLVESIRVQIERPRKCLIPKRAQTLLHAEFAAGPVESERCRALEHVEATKCLVAKELSLRRNV